VDLEHDGLLTDIHVWSTFCKKGFLKVRFLNGTREKALMKVVVDMSVAATVYQYISIYQYISVYISISCHILIKQIKEF